MKASKKKTPNFFWNSGDFDLLFYLSMLELLQRKGKSKRSRNMIGKEFILAGKATFTLEIPEHFSAMHTTPPHYTFRVTHKEASMRFPEAWFVSLLTGPDNENSYSYVGMLSPSDGKINLTRKSACPKTSMVVRLLERTLERVWANEGDKIEAAGFKLHHAGKCGKCGKTLTVPESVESGFGPECVKKLKLMLV